MISFTVPGQAVAKARARRAPDGHWYTPKRTQEYETTVGLCAMQAKFKPQPDQYWSVTLQVFTTSKRADIDNVAKSVLDGLNALPHFDDRSVVRLLVQQTWIREADDQRVVVTLEEAEKPGWTEAGTASGMAENVGSDDDDN